MKSENHLSNSRLNLIEEFNRSPDNAWFTQATPAAIRNCSESTIERDRWAGCGIPFVKCGRSVRYRKLDIANWLENHNVVYSTSEYKCEVNHA